MTVTAKSTKAEILTAYRELLARSEAQYVTTPLLVSSFKLVARELQALAHDIYRLGYWCGGYARAMLSTYSKPLLR